MIQGPGGNGINHRVVLTILSPHPQPHHFPSNSPSPSRMCDRVVASTRASNRLTRSVENVLIWLILTQDLFGNPGHSISIVSGNPARGCWLVNAMAMTVPDFWLNRSTLRMRTGLKPDCSCPIVGFRSAQRTSPLSMSAKNLPQSPYLVQPRGVPARDQS